LRRQSQGICETSSAKPGVTAQGRGFPASHAPAHHDQFSLCPRAGHAPPGASRSACRRS
jgi:hypothetical protein